MVVVLKEGVQLEDGRVAEAGVDGHLLPHPVDEPARCDLALVDLVLMVCVRVLTSNDILFKLFIYSNETD